ncbi:MAG: DUF3471 domain-containing protein, partial [Gemmatimonadales bacterium]
SPSHALEDYVGRFGNDLYGHVEVTLRGDELYLERGPGLRGPLEHWHYDTFRARWEAGWRGRPLMSFHVDAGGKISALEIQGQVLTRLE